MVLGEGSRGMGAFEPEDHWAVITPLLLSDPAELLWGRGPVYSKMNLSKSASFIPPLSIARSQCSPPVMCPRIGTL